MSETRYRIAYNRAAADAGDTHPWECDIFCGDDWRGGCDYMTGAEALAAYIEAANRNVATTPTDTEPETDQPEEGDK